MASSDGGSDGDNIVGTCQQLAGMTMSPKLEEATVVTTDNSADPMNISVLHDYAMDHVFSFLPMTDLKNCRLVNHSWNRASNGAIQKRDFAIKLPKDPYVHDGCLEEMEDIPQLIQLIGTSFQFPWTKFKVDKAWMNDTQEQHRLGNLLRAISPFVTEMDIENLCYLPDLEFPNLRKLDLFYVYSEAVPTGSNQLALLRLVERASKLNDLDIIGQMGLKSPFFMDLLEVPNCRKITRLSLSWWIEGKHLVKLSEMGLKLMYLSLAFELKNVTVESVNAILQSQSTCLETLELYTAEDNAEVDIRDWGWESDDEEIDPNPNPRPRLLFGLVCPRMEKLKLLRVPSANIYSRISYKEMFPALKKLIFGDSDPSPMDNFFNDDIEPVDTVEYIRFAYWPGNPERILHAARQFPKLRRVSLMVLRNLLNVLGYVMPQLEELELEIMDDVNDLDSILTGFPSVEILLLKELPSSQLDMLERCKQSVHFLKKLRRLRIFSKFRGVQRSLSDFGCRFALLKMEHLQILELKGNFNQISEPVMERMREKFILRLETD